VVPAPFGALAALACVPCGVDMLGDFKRRILPAESCTRSRDFGIPERRAVRRTGIGLVRCALGDHGLATDERRARPLALSLLQRPVDCVGVMAVHAGYHLPSVAFEAAPHVVGIPLADVAFF